MSRIAVLCSIACFAVQSVALPAYGQTNIKPYDGPPIYLDKLPEPIPARQTGHSVQTKKYDDDSPWIKFGVSRYSDGSFESHGIYQEFYRDGKQFLDGQYEKGTPSGEWTYWHPTGQIAKKVTYRNGHPDGKIEVYRPDGTLETRKEFTVGKRSGKWEQFDESGEKLVFEGSYEKGQPAGVWKRWFANGQLQREVTYVDGKIGGLYKEWYDDGAKRAEINFKAGKRHGLATEWRRSGEKVEANFEDGQRASR